MAAVLLMRRTRPLIAVRLTFVLFSGLHIAGASFLLFSGQFVPMLLSRRCCS